MRNLPVSRPCIYIEVRDYANETNLSMNSFINKPISCKLGDLGEARSSYLQTKCLVENSKTKSVCRGSPAYMAPEIIVDEIMLNTASIDQLMAVDVWALLLTIYIAINPDCPYPFYHEISQDKGNNVITNPSEMC